MAGKPTSPYASASLASSLSFEQHVRRAWTEIIDETFIRSDSYVDGRLVGFHWHTRPRADASTLKNVTA